MNTDKPSRAVRGGLIELVTMLASILKDVVNSHPDVADTIINQIEGAAKLTAQLTTEYTEKRDWMEARIKELETENEKLGQIASEYWLLNTRRKLQQGLPFSPLRDNKSMRAEYKI